MTTKPWQVRVGNVAVQRSDPHLTIEISPVGTEQPGNYWKIEKKGDNTTITNVKNNNRITFTEEIGRAIQDALETLYSWKDDHGSDNAST